MIARITTETLDAIVAETIAESGREACGLLFGTGDRIVAHRSARNVADDPRQSFEIDPAVLLDAHRAARNGGPAIVGCYHSHPTGAPEPSARDATDAEPNGWLWLIVGAGEAKLWRAVPDGPVHGRFEPVPFTCVDGPPAPESALSG